MANFLFNFRCLFVVYVTHAFSVWFGSAVGNMAEERQGGRRYPQNLQGVLQLAVEAGSATDGPTPLEPMSEEVSKLHGMVITLLNPLQTL